MEISYYNDYNENYLVVKCSEKALEKQFPFKMITQNHIDGILQCNMRFIDGETYLYYNITSKQNLLSMFKSRKMDDKQLHSILDCLLKVFSSLKQYLLDYHCLILKEEYIYYDAVSENVEFMYYPAYGAEMEKEEDPNTFAEFLLEVYDHDKTETVSLIYQLYNQSIQKGLTDRILKHCLEEYSACSDTIRLNEEIHTPRKEEAPSHAETQGDPKERSSAKNVQPEYSLNEDLNNRDGENRKDDSEHNNESLVPAIFFWMCGAGTAYFRSQYNLSAHLELLTFTGMITCFVLGFILFLFFLLKKIRRAQKVKVAECSGESAACTVYDEASETETSAQKQEAEQEDYGNTVFLGSLGCKEEHKLYGMNKGNKYHIDLNILPLTVGKMAGYVDVQINDPSLSRMHVRFERGEDSIIMTDLNSTNGTYKNGLRLSPNESAEIETGDEIKLGKLIFSYR